jgi:hypothetical protein
MEDAKDRGFRLAIARAAELAQLNPFRMLSNDLDRAERLGHNFQKVSIVAVSFRNAKRSFHFQKSLESMREFVKKTEWTVAAE